MPVRRHFSLEKNIHSEGIKRGDIMLQIKKWGLYILTSMCLIAIMVCVICDYAITKTLTWSLIILLSLIAGWLVFVPFLEQEAK